MASLVNMCAYIMCISACMCVNECVRSYCIVLVRRTVDSIPSVLVYTYMCCHARARACGRVCVCTRTCIYMCQGTCCLPSCPRTSHITTLLLLPLDRTELCHLSSKKSTLVMPQHTKHFATCTGHVCEPN